MKKLVALVLSVLMIASVFCGCQASGGASVDVSTVTSGVLTVATSPDFAPMEFVDPTKSGQDMYVGFDITLAKYIADSLGLTLQIMPMSFEACQTAVYAGTVDMAISGFSWKEDRAANYNLSDYYHAGDNEDEQILITLAANGDKYATLEGLKGAKIGVQNASLQQSLSEEQLTECEIIPFTDLGTAVLQLKNGDFDCIAVADGNGDSIMVNNPEIAKSGFNFEVDEKYTGNVVLLHKGDDALTVAVNEALASSKDLWDGWYAEAQATSGVEHSYDDNGNAVTENTEDTNDASEGE